ncbi:MAG: glycosyltransferase family 1 protein [Cytophagales bacterium]|nr:MAG: glycosyltransferase family 1 protein [Cytophagales bacterium]
MRIAIVLNSSWNIYNFRKGLVQTLLREGHQVLAIAPKDEYSEKLEEWGCKYVDVKMDNKGTNPIKDFYYLYQLWTIFKKEKPDIVLQFTIKPNIFGAMAAALCGIPAVNNVCGLGTTFLQKHWTSTIAQWLYKVSFRFPQKVYFQNVDDLSVFIENRLVDKNISDLLPGSGVSLQEFQPQPFQRNPQFTFLMLSRLITDKGVREFAEAGHILKQKGINAKLLLVGSYDPNDYLRIPQKELELWQKEQWIEYVGSAKDVKPYINQADCIVLPSYREGTPRSLLEAASMAKPLIATRVAGCRQTIDDGQNGYLCEVKNAHDLAQKMMQMYALSDEELTLMGEKSRKKAEKQFDEKIVVHSYLKTIQEICAPLQK